MRTCTYGTPAAARPSTLTPLPVDRPNSAASSRTTWCSRCCGKHWRRLASSAGARPRYRASRCAKTASPWIFTPVGARSRAMLLRLALMEIRSNSIARARAPTGVESQGDAVVVHLEAPYLGRAPALDASLLQCLPQHRLHQVVLDDAAEFGLSTGSGVKVDGRAAAGVPYVHVRIGPDTCLANGRPDAQLVQQADRRGRQADHAQVDLVLDPPGCRRARLDQRGGKALARQRQRGRGADHAATDDGDIELGPTPAGGGVARAGKAAHGSGSSTARGGSPRKPMPRRASICCSGGTRS